MSDYKYYLKEEHDPLETIYDINIYKCTLKAHLIGETPNIDRIAAVLRNENTYENIKMKFGALLALIEIIKHPAVKDKRNNIRHIDTAFMKPLVDEYLDQLTDIAIEILNIQTASPIFKDLVFDFIFQISENFKGLSLQGQNIVRAKVIQIKHLLDRDAKKSGSITKEILQEA